MNGLNLYDNKLDIINKFIEKNKHLAVQGSKQWLEERTFTIGGSEMAVITGDNPYKSVKQLISQKVNLEKFIGNVATRWGNFMEPITELIVKILFTLDNLIYTTGAIPHYNMPCHKYSPDGICIMEYLQKIIIVLLEFKAPFTRHPDDKIPKYYIPQLMSGMDTINISEAGLFVNNMYRFCSIKDLNSVELKYNNDFHSYEKDKITDFCGTIASGLILLYIDNIDKLEEHIEYYTTKKYGISLELLLETNADKCDVIHNIYDTLNNKKPPLHDIGSFSKIELEFILLMIDKRVIHAIYLEPFINNGSLCVNNPNVVISKELYNCIKKNGRNTSVNHKEKIFKALNQLPKHCKSIGVIGWKLLKASFIMIEKEECYVEKYRERIEKVINEIHIVDKLDSPEVQVEYIRNIKI